MSFRVAREAHELYEILLPGCDDGIRSQGRLVPGAERPDKSQLRLIGPTASTVSTGETIRNNTIATHIQRG